MAILLYCLVLLLERRLLAWQNNSPRNSNHKPTSGV
jgi:hypothetical protein